MNIQSAIYIRDDDDNETGIHVVTDEAPGGLARDIPIDGKTWLNAALSAWLAADPVSNKIGG